MQEKSFSRNYLALRPINFFNHAVKESEDHLISNEAGRKPRAEFCTQRVSVGGWSAPATWRYDTVNFLWWTFLARRMACVGLLRTHMSDRYSAR